MDIPPRPGCSVYFRGHLLQWRERMTEVQKLVSIVVAPSKAFDAINRRPTWILPLGLLFRFTLLADFVVYRVVVTDANFERIARAKIEWDARASAPRPVGATPEPQIEVIKLQRKIVVGNYSSSPINRKSTARRNPGCFALGSSDVCL